VTGTWLNIADYVSKDGINACSPLASSAVRKGKCIVSHYKVKTNAHKLNICEISGDTGSYKVKCYPK